MAGDWIKVQTTTADKPEISQMARLLKIDRDAVFGKLIRLWSWVDANSVDGSVGGVVSTDIDDLCRCDGFAAACVGVGWLVVDAKAARVLLPNFAVHNGESAKKRALKNRSQAKWRDGVVSHVDGLLSLNVLPEKRREEKSNSSCASAKADAPDTVPFRAIVDLYNAAMLSLPKARSITGKRKAALKAAWLADPARQNLKFWVAYWAELADDDWLSGRGQYRPGWRPTLEYLLREDVITKVHEAALDGRDRRGAAA